MFSEPVPCGHQLYCTLRHLCITFTFEYGHIVSMCTIYSVEVNVALLLHVTHETAFTNTLLVAVRFINVNQLQKIKEQGYSHI